MCWTTWSSDCDTKVILVLLDLKLVWTVNFKLKIENSIHWTYMATLCSLRKVHFCANINLYGLLIYYKRNHWNLTGKDYSLHHWSGINRNFSSFSAELSALTGIELLSMALLSPTCCSTSFALNTSIWQMHGFLCNSPYFQEKVSGPVFTTFG